MKKPELELFQHNRRAYEAAVRLMEENGRAAVIHPTGTGKSFVAFKLAEEHPQSRILWLSPSEYIYQTQVENLVKAMERAGEETAAVAAADRITAGITFMTYTRLMMNGGRLQTDLRGRSEEEQIEEELSRTAGTQPEDHSSLEYIILDEFHRCGATEWEKSVKQLLRDHPEAKILGLSATKVRFLDGQRDMAQELFEGCIASEMSLGEAVARGILPTPRYVISLYSCQDELIRLRKRVDESRVPGLRQENESLLEELRRTLEKAEGLDELFSKYMKDSSGNPHRGKYIVFCSNRAHMEEMAARSRDWFARVDPQPHLYTVYYDHPKTSRAFVRFKEDSSEHLRLLFCIDMLNEGIHVDDIDGVILLRPTVSPIIYLQQIGRALSASRQAEGSAIRTPTIFDIVLNCESLRHIDVLQAQIEEAFSMIPCGREEKSRFEESFRIYDELISCRELFDRLNRNLTAAWESYYQAARNYYEAHGNLHIVKSYVTSDGLTLGTWLMTQRRIRNGSSCGNLSEEQIGRLDAIGMEWEMGSDRKWKRGYEALRAYVETYGNADVKAAYVNQEGYPLGKWIHNLRCKWNRGEIECDENGFGNESGNENGTGNEFGNGFGEPDHAGRSVKLLSRQQIAQLNELGMIWDKKRYFWEVNFRRAENYYRVHGDLNVPRRYETEDGMKLGIWLDNQRQAYGGKNRNRVPLEQSQIRRLEAIGMVWRRQGSRNPERYTEKT